MNGLWTLAKDAVIGLEKKQVRIAKIPDITNVKEHSKQTELNTKNAIRNNPIIAVDIPLFNGVVPQQPFAVLCP